MYPLLVVGTLNAEQKIVWENQRKNWAFETFRYKNGNLNYLKTKRFIKLSIGGGGGGEVATLIK